MIDKTECGCTDACLHKPGCAFEKYALARTKKDCFLMSDIVGRLQQRAKVAREEMTGTSLGDALHFEEAGAEIERLRNQLVKAREALNLVFRYSHEQYVVDVALKARNEISSQPDDQGTA